MIVLIEGLVLPNVLRKSSLPRTISIVLLLIKIVVVKADFILVLVDEILLVWILKLIIRIIVSVVPIAIELIVLEIVSWAEWHRALVCLLLKLSVLNKGVVFHS